MFPSGDGDDVWAAGSGMCSSGDGDGVGVAGSGMCSPGDGDVGWGAGPEMRSSVDGGGGWGARSEMCSSVDNGDGLIFPSGMYYTRADSIGVKSVGPEMSSTARGDGEGAACPGESSLAGDGG